MRRYEIRPDPDRMRQYGITLQELESAIRDSNAKVGGSFITQGKNIQIIRTIGLIGGGQDPMDRATCMATPAEAANYLRKAERERMREIREVVNTAIRNVPVRVGMIVEDGPVADDEELGKNGIVVDNEIRQGQIGFAQRLRPEDNVGKVVKTMADSKTPDGQTYIDDDDFVQGIVLLRKGEKLLQALDIVKKQIAELNVPGKLLPGVQWMPYYDRTSLIGVTTETVHENLLVGLIVVTAILLAFLGNVRTAIIHGTEHLVRPITMTALAAILGLLPAAFATKVGSQSQRPLAIVVVGGMFMTLMLFNLVPLLDSFYGKRTPPDAGPCVGY